MVRGSACILLAGAGGESLKLAPVAKRSAMDIGGTRVRIYEFQGAEVLKFAEIDLPLAEPNEDAQAWGRRRVDALCALVCGWTGECPGGRLPTACAGLKDPEQTEVLESFYGSPLPKLVDRVREQCGLEIGPLYDDDVAAARGQLDHPLGGLDRESPDTILLTAGTGVAEALWVRGQFLPKTGYPRLSALGLESELRAQAWRDTELPLRALGAVLLVRREIGDFRRLVLSGRFASASRPWPERLAWVEVAVVSLPEAPAYGALHLARGAFLTP